MQSTLNNFVSGNIVVWVWSFLTLLSWLYLTVYHSNNSALISYECGNVNTSCKLSRHVNSYVKSVTALSEFYLPLIYKANITKSGILLKWKLCHPRLTYTVLHVEKFGKSFWRAKVDTFPVKVPNKLRTKKKMYSLWKSSWRSKNEVSYLRLVNIVSEWG